MSGTEPASLAHTVRGMALAGTQRWCADRGLRDNGP